MKKILIFIDSLGSGGAQRRAVNIAKLLNERGYVIEFLLYQDIVFYDEASKRFRITIVKRKNKITRLFYLLKKLRDSEADVVISFIETPNHIACFAKRIGAKWKLITTESSSKGSTFIGVKNRIYNRLESCSDYKVCNSINSTTMWKNYCPWMGNKVVTIYNPILIEKNNFDVSKDPKLRILVAASYQNVKNPEILIKAVNQLHHDEKDSFVLEWYGRKEAVKGDCTLYNKCLKMVEDYKLEKCISLNEETKDIYSKIIESDFVALFSALEGMPNSIAEGMMLGRPVIMTKVSDYNMLVDGNGVLCESNDTIGITRALRKAINLDGEMIKKMGRKSREIAEVLFDSNKVIEQWIQLIEGE